MTDPFQTSDHVSLHFALNGSDSPMEIRLLDSVPDEYDPFDGLTILQRRHMALRLRHWADRVDELRTDPRRS